MLWLEISADYTCNNACVGCFSVAQPGQGPGQSMSTAEAIETLVWGRRGGARYLWLGGGDPTMRADLAVIVAQARRLGYERVKLETNGMRLADETYMRRAQVAGVTEVSFSIKGATAEAHDWLTRTPGCHALMVRGMNNARALGLPLTADVLVYKSNAHELPDIVRTYSALGVTELLVWLLSATDSSEPAVREEVPRIADVMPHLTAAMDLGLATITSLHTPPCTVPASHHACLFHAPSLGLVVANPGRHRFRLEESPIEGGHYKPSCEPCRHRARCGGMRGDYVAIHGDGEFVPPAESA